MNTFKLFKDDKFNGIISDKILKVPEEQSIPNTGVGVIGELVTVNDALYMKTSLGWTQISSLSPVTEFTSSGNLWTGPGATGLNIEFKLTKIGNIVTLSLQFILQEAVNSSIATASVLIPVGFRPLPLTTNQALIIVRDSLASTVGKLSITDAGLMTMNVGTGSQPFQASLFWGFETQSITYLSS